MLTFAGPATAGPTGYNSHLTRAPYLTDLVGRHVAINYATDRSATTLNSSPTWSSRLMSTRYS